jgi:hypothetical protein
VAAASVEIPSHSIPLQRKAARGVRAVRPSSSSSSPSAKSDVPDRGTAEGLLPQRPLDHPCSDGSAHIAPCSALNSLVDVTIDNRRVAIAKAKAKAKAVDSVAGLGGEQAAGGARYSTTYRGTRRYLQGPGRWMVIAVGLLPPSSPVTSASFLLPEAAQRPNFGAAPAYRRLEVACSSRLWGGSSVDASLALLVPGGGHPRAQWTVGRMKGHSSSRDLPLGTPFYS